MKNTLHKIVVTFGCLLVMAPLYGQHYKLTGQIEGGGHVKLEGATLLVLAADTLLAGAVSDAKGAFSISGLPAGTYHIQLSLLGYKPYEQDLQVSGNTKLQLPPLIEDTRLLDEVVVSADRRDLIKRSAGKSTFLLSKQALKSANVYDALQEIPKLMVDGTNRKISLSNGTSPLILVNGVNRPGYIESLDPSDIEEVEVVENPSSRYRGEQTVQAILNLKVKRKKQTYANGNLYSRHHPEGVFGVSGASFEIGNSLSSLYLNAQHFYFHNDDGETDSYSRNGDFVRELSGTSRYNAQSVYLNLGGDWIANDKNYWAFGISFITNPTRQRDEKSGIVRSDSEPASPLTTWLALKNNYYTNTNNLFYRHTFNNTHHLEVTASLGFAGSGSGGNRSEKSSLYAYDSNIDLDNIKQSLKTEANYDYTIGTQIAANVGANTYLQKMRIDDRLDLFVPFAYKNLTEYIYADIQSKWDKPFSYMVSLGVDMVFNQSDGEKNRYINFVPSASFTYNFNKKNSLQLNFQRSRTSPEATMLNPRNTSTDSLYVIVGNPLLKPSVSNSADVRYTYQYKNLYLEPFVTYSYHTDMIQNVGSTEGAVYKQTFENTDRMQNLKSGLTARINLSTFGNLNLTGYYRKYFIRDASFSGNSWGMNGFLFLYYKKVSLRMNVFYEKFQYTRTTKIDFTPESEATVTWNLPKGWSLNAGLRYFAAGSFYNRMWVKDGAYESYANKNFSDRYMMPLVGVQYYFRNKINMKWRNKKQLYNQDTGIRIEVK